MKPLPIGWKFGLWAAAVAGCVLVVFGVVTFLHLREEEREEVDLELMAETRRVASLDEPAVRDREIDELVRFQSWISVVVFDLDGRLRRQAGKLSETVARSALGEAGIVSRNDSAGLSWRVRAMRRDDVMLVVGHSTEEMDEVIADLFVGYGVSLPVVLVVAAVGGWWVSRRALSPLRSLTQAAENVEADHLDRRVPVPGADDEIRRLAEVLNAMLGRLQGSFQQAQRFAADASHELRTPLTIMQGEVEQLLRTAPLERSQEEKLLSLQEEISRLDRITEQLLLLARFDSGYATAGRARVDLTGVVRAACEDAELLADARGTKLAPVIAPAVIVSGDDAHLRRLVLSLLDNATRYNHPGGQVECRLETRGNQAVLRVRNTGPGIPAEARARLFQRFFRADPARTRGGHGLGLSLSREIARAHGGRIELAADAAPGWTEFVVTLPRAEPA